MSTNNYFLNVNTYFRDVDKYPNPCDFGISFNKFTGTGTFVQGAPLNPSSFFQQCSIDPDFGDDDLRLINATINNINRTDTEVVVSGLFDLTLDFQIKYKNTTLYLKTGTSFAGYPSDIVWNTVEMPIPFLIKFAYDSNADIPYSISWLTYIKPTSIPNIFYNSSRKATFHITDTGNIYFMFDFTMRYFNFIIEKNYTEIIITSVSNPTIPSDLTDDFLGNYGSVCVCLTYLDKDGDVGITNGHAYGYHIFSNTYDLIGSESNGEISLEVDTAENAYVCLNTNPTMSTPSKITQPYNQWTQGQSETLTDINNPGFFDNQTGAFTIYNTQLLFYPAISSISTGPFGLVFVQDNPTSSYLKNTFVYPETGSTDNKRIASSNAFTGTSSELFLWISSVKDANLTSATGSKIYKVDKNNGFSMTGVGFVSSTGVASLCYATLGGTNYLLSKNLTNYVDIYSFNTNTYATTRLTGVQISSTYFFNYTIFYTIIGTDIYFFFIPQFVGLLPSTYWYKQSQTGYVLKYDTLGNILSLYNTIPNVSNIPGANIGLNIRNSSVYLFLPRSGNSNIDAYDLTDPSNIVLRNSIPTNNWADLTIYQTTYNGVTKYYLSQGIRGNSLVNYDITDVNNIFEVGNNNFGFQYYRISRPYSFHDGYFWNILYTTSIIVDQPVTFTKIKSPILDQTLSSVHFNQNLAKTSPSPTGATVCCTFNSNNKAYVAFASQSYLTIYDITSIRATSYVSQIALGLPTTVYDVKTIIFNNSQYFLITGMGFVFAFILSSTLNSITPVGLYTAIPDAYLEGNLFIFNNNLFAVTVGYTTSYLLRFIFSPSLTFTGFAAIDPGKLGLLLGTFYDPKAGVQVCGTSSTVNFTSTNDNYKYYDVSSGNTPTFLGFIAGLPCFLPRSASSLIDPSSSKTYLAAYTPIAIGLFDLSNFDLTIGGTNGGDLAFVDYESVDISRSPNGKSRLFYTDTLYSISNVYGGTGTSGDYLKCFDLTNLSSGKQIFNDIKVAGTGATGATPIYNIDMQISQLNNRITLVCLNSDGNFYLYDISNPYYAGKYQDRGLISSSYLSPYSIGSSLVIKLDNEGNEYYKTWLRNVQQGSGPSGQLINISNLKISNDNLSFYVCGGYKDQIQTYSPDATGTISNQIVSYGKGYDGYLAKCDTITGKWTWITPVYGEKNDYMQKIQYTSSNRIVLGGYTDSQNMVVYQKQNAGSTVTPTIPQTNIVGSTNNTNSFVMLFTTDGVLSWNNSIFSTDPQSTVDILDIGYEGTQLVATGLTNAKTVKCIDVSKTNVQDLTTFNDTTIKYSLINYYFDTNGNYLKSQNINLPEYASATINDIKLNSSSNNITLTPSITYSLDTLNTYYNKDGTLAYQSTGISNKTVSYITNYVYDSSFTDTNGKQYSYVKLQSPLTYGFTGSFFKNYRLYMGPSVDTTYLNKSFSIRDNIVYATGDYRFILNSKIDTSKIDRTITATVSGITGTNEYQLCSLSSSPLTSIFEYTVTDSTHITSVNLSGLDTSKQYYITLPKYGDTYSYNVLGITTDVNGDYVFQVEDVNNFRTSTGAAFYGPYLYLTQFNQNILYNLQFYPASLIYPVYYTIQLNSLVLPNRPLRQSPNDYVRTLTDLQYIYVAIFSVDDSDIADREIVNIVYDNNPNRDKVEIFQLNTLNVGDASNFVTYTSSQVPKVKFNSQFTTLRIKIFDVYGNVLLFDNTPYKSTDSIFTGTTVPDQFMNISIQFTLKKI